MSPLKRLIWVRARSNKKRRFLSGNLRFIVSMKEIAVDILLCIVDRQRTLMKGDKVVELLEKCTNLLLLSVSGNHIPSLM